MQAYINSIGIISAQKTYDGFPEEIAWHEDEKYMSAIEPPYKEFINPVQLRRMSRVLKMGLGASKICLNNSPNTPIDGIIVGTGLACISDLEKFLLNLLNENEQCLSPIPFINSSHNTVAAQIAMINKITGYNATYTNRGTSFESALQDALMQVYEKEAENILVGGIDEYSQNYESIFSLLGYWNGKEAEKSVKLGEGAAFFILSNTPDENTYAQLKDVFTFINPVDTNEITCYIQDFLAKNGLSLNELDAIILGNNQSDKDIIYKNVEELLQEDTPVLHYKNLSGEYMTSTGFAMWLASEILKRRTIPDFFHKKNYKYCIKNILIYNHYNCINHSLILLTTI